MRDVVEFETGPDGEPILTLDTAGSEYVYQNLIVELGGRTNHIATPGRKGTVGRETVHGDSG